MEVATGCLRRKLFRKQEGLLARGDTLTGKIALWCLHELFKLETGALTLVEMSKLMSLRIDNDLEVYLDKLDSILSTLGKDSDDDLLLALVERQLRKAKRMSHEFVRCNEDYCENCSDQKPSTRQRSW